MKHLSLVDGPAAQVVHDLDMPRVTQLQAVLQAHTQPREFAAAVCLNLEPMISGAREDVSMIEATLAEALDRLAKLERLAAAAEGIASGTEETASYRVVKGAQIAVVAVQEARTAGRTELHYDEWFRLIREAGWVIESRNPQAAFLTSLSRSRLVERVGERSGVYRVKEDA